MPISREEFEKSPDEEEMKVERIKRFLENNPDKAFTYEEIEEEVGFSPMGFQYEVSDHKVIEGVEYYTAIRRRG